MTVNESFDVKRAQIQFATETKAFELDGSKVVAQPLKFFRHIYAELIHYEANGIKLLLETNSNQAYICNFIIMGNNLDYIIGAVQRSKSLSTINSTLANFDDFSLYRLSGTQNVYDNIYLPPSTKLYIRAFNPIEQLFLTCERYYVDGISKA